MGTPFNSVEVLGKRTANAKHYRLEDGTYQAQISLGDIHYPDVNGQWQDIDTSLFDDANFDTVSFPVYAEKNAEFTLRKMEVQNFKAKGNLDRTRGNFHGLRVPHDSKIAKLFSKGYEIGRGTDRLKFKPVGVSQSIGQLDSTNSSCVKFSGAWHDADVCLELHINGIKETITLKSANAPTTFTFKVEGGLTADLICGALKLEPAWLEDAAGTKRDVQQTVRTDASGNTFIDLVADVTGLVFPVVIDPTVTIQPVAASAYDSYVRSNVATTNYGTDTVISVGNDSGTNRAFLKFGMSSIPTGSDVISATLTLWQTTAYKPSGYDANATVAAYRVIDSWTEASITWSNQPRYDSSTKSSTALLTDSTPSLDVTTATQSILNSTNYGYALIGSNDALDPTLVSTNNRTDYLSENNANNTPKLVVNYDIPPSAPTVTYPNGGETLNASHTITWNASNDSSAASISGANHNTSVGPLTNTGAASTVVSTLQTFTTAYDATFLANVSHWMLSNGTGGVYSWRASIYNVDANGWATTEVVGQNLSYTFATSEWAQFTANFNVQLSPNTNYAFVVTATANNANLYAGISNVALTATGCGVRTYYTTKIVGGNNSNSGNGFGMSITMNFSTPSSQLQYNIDYSRDNGATWSNIVALTAAGATSYTYDFTNVPQTATALVRIRAYDGVGYGAYDQSNGVFTIQHNQAPNAPTHTNISNLGGSYNKRPKFFINVSDPDAGNTITNAQFQISTVNTFASTVMDVQKGSDSGFGTTTAGWSGIPTAGNASTQISWTPQADLPVQILYIRVRSKDNNNTWSAWSATQAFTIIAAPWADAPNGYGMKATWMNDLATAINNVRQFRGIAAATFTDGTIATQDANGNGTDIKAAHVTERRTKITDVYTALATASPTWTNVTVDNTKDRNTAEVVDLRNAVIAA